MPVAAFGWCCFHRGPTKWGDVAICVSDMSDMNGE